jgi:hypothetical protein
VIEELGDKISQILSSAGVPFTAHRTSLVVDCQAPICGKAEHTWIRRVDGATKCMVCGSTWNAVGILSRILGKSKAAVSSMLFGNDSGESLAFETFEFDKLQIDEVDEFDAEAAPTESNPVVDLSYLHPIENSQACVEYLATRGVSLDLAKKLDLRCHSFINGVFFLAKNPQGYTEGYQYRNIKAEKGAPKTVTMKGFKKNLHLLFIEHAQSAESWILVEGPFDAVKCMLPGYAAVASYGKLVSNQQIQMILDSSCKTVFVGLDRDAAKEANEVIEKLSVSKRVFRLLPPEHRDDLGECSQEEVANSIAQAIPCVGARTERLEVFLDD